MRGSAAPGRRRLRVQLRVSNMRAPYGRSLWSEPLQLDALGGAAIVTVPCPGPSPSYAQPDARAAYALSVTASQVLPIFLSRCFRTQCETSRQKGQHS